MFYWMNIVTFMEEYHRLWDMNHVKKLASALNICPKIQFSIVSQTAEVIMPPMPLNIYSNALPKPSATPPIKSPNQSNIEKFPLYIPRMPQMYSGAVSINTNEANKIAGAASSNCPCFR